MIDGCVYLGSFLLASKKIGLWSTGMLKLLHRLMGGEGVYDHPIFLKTVASIRGDFDSV